MPAKTTPGLFLKRFVVFLIGVPGYLLTFMPWLFTLGFLAYVVASYSQNGFVAFEVSDLVYSTFSVNWSTILSSILITIGLWLFIAWMTKRFMLAIAHLFGGSERTWQTVRLVGLLGGWGVIFLLAAFVFKNVVPGFMLSLLFTTTLGLLSFALEFLAQRLLLNHKSA